ncbi:hypothetical protein [Streptomyces sp. ML-6]|uniref:hypothetical protein n=1 Tax=Streptomyces sp. ML-6 TaxID=2982693 RepID=UPI0024BF4908|nr:hypothetical protein [Streptomyces sp. ML-6]MDK0524728.1 hypothetical protein [Streptomyces sp. ML-6]
MIRDLYNVRWQPAEDGPTPLTDEEERRVRAVLFSELGNTIADRGWVRFPAYSPEERRRLIDVAHRLTSHWGQQVFVEAEDQCSLRLFLAGHEARPAQPSLPQP